MTFKILCAAVVMCVAAPAHAQQPVVPDTKAINVTGSLEVMNQYIFRGVRQNVTGLAIWPAADLGFNVHSGDGALKLVRLKAGFLNSLHTGDTGSRGPAGKSWYESRFSGGVALHLARGVSVEGSYTAFTSPNEMFTTSNEVGVKVAIDNRMSVGGAALRPYAFMAFEVGAGTGEGQLDGGMKAGRYLELGVAPAFAASGFEFAVPISVGLSAGNYYELATEDHAFGFAGVGAVATVPLRRSSGSGSWSIRGGVHYQTFGTTTKAFNGGDRSLILGSIGLGFSY